MSELLSSLQEWYAAQCDGAWEHARGIAITTCDHQGWWVKIELPGTRLENRPFKRVDLRVAPNGFPLGNRWLCCFVKDGVWHGTGDETKLEVILRTFLDWALIENASDHDIP